MSSLRTTWATLRANRWPLYLTGLMAISIGAQGVLVFVATRSNSPRPVQGYYERSKRWDEDDALRAASAELGWQVRFDVAAGPEQVAGMPHPVDVRVTDRANRPVSGLSAELLAARPSDPRLDERVKLVELPHEAGRYRALVRLGAPGIWRFGLDARRDGLRFVHEQRVTLPAFADSLGGAE